MDPSPGQPAQGRLFGLVTVGDEARHEVYQEVDRAAMASMLDLTDVFELLVDGFDDHPLAQEHGVRQLRLRGLRVLCCCRGEDVPRKIRQLKADLRKAGYTQIPRRGKGSHTWWEHPHVPDYFVDLSGHDGDDAKPYQEKAVREATARARKG
jgi:hypothetical protein